MAFAADLSFQVPAVQRETEHIEQSRAMSC